MSLSVNGDDEGDDFLVQPFTIKMDLVTAIHQLSSSALIDSGADCNVMSYDIWQFLGKPNLVPSKLTFQNFSGTHTTSLGKICVKICIQDQTMHIPFHVANKDQAFVNVVLG